MQKEQRWYEVVEGVLYVYSEPYPEKAQHVTITRIEDLPYYRSTFLLRKIWK